MIYNSIYEYLNIYSYIIIMIINCIQYNIYNKIYSHLFKNIYRPFTVDFKALYRVTSYKGLTIKRYSVRPLRIDLNGS